MNIIKTWVRGASWRRTPRAADDGGSGPTRGGRRRAAIRSRTSMPPPRAIRDIGRSGTLAVNAGCGRCGGLTGPGARDAPRGPRVGAAPPERETGHGSGTLGHGRGPKGRGRRAGRS